LRERGEHVCLAKGRRPPAKRKGEGGQLCREKIDVSTKKADPKGEGGKQGPVLTRGGGGNVFSHQGKTVRVRLSDPRRKKRGKKSGQRFGERRGSSLPGERKKREKRCYWIDGAAKWEISSKEL